jgi:hypothetical protein
VVVSGLTNTYASYVTTWEEYQAQRYEGASTLYGAHTLGAYIQVGSSCGGRAGRQVQAVGFWKAEGAACLRGCWVGGAPAPGTLLRWRARQRHPAPLP